MAQINNTFNVKFDLISIPTLVLTDTTVSPPTGLVGFFTITQPDGYTRTGNISSPDIASSGGVFSFPLRLDSTGNVQNGEYKIIYTASAPSVVSNDFTRVFQFSYTPVDLVMVNSFDVFTPSLKYVDNTIYQSSGYNASSVARLWTATSTPTGAITGTTQLLDLIKVGKYYDAFYNIKLDSTITYTHQVYTYLTIQEKISKTIETYAQTPPSLDQIITKIGYLKSVMDGLVNTTYSYLDAKADFETAQTFFTHIIDKLKIGNTTNINKNIFDLITVLNKTQSTSYTPTNAIIPPYDITEFTGSPKWGKITGSLSSQTDLWAYIQSFEKRDNYVHNQAVSASTWVINHNMGKNPSVSIVDTANDEVEGDVKYNSINQITITFTAAFSGKAFLN